MSPLATTHAAVGHRIATATWIVAPPLALGLLGLALAWWSFTHWSLWGLGWAVLFLGAPILLLALLPVVVDTLAAELAES